jgi:hypothetical protein
LTGKNPIYTTIFAIDAGRTRNTNMKWRLNQRRLEGETPPELRRLASPTSQIKISFVSMIKME